ncbi:MAG: STAS domain-containing protein [Fibrobacterota bacterium]|jgi:anti-anti-sigma factor|nr:STAS domain-containing protein [Chitinispirillaceae bacterium]
MESQIELLYEDIPGRSNARLIRFVGDLDATNVQSVLEKLNSLFSEGFTRLVADFKKLRYVNSAGLGILLYFTKTVREKGGTFKIANVCENVYEIIEIIGATSLLEIYDELNEAIAELN